MQFAVVVRGVVFMSREIQKISAFMCFTECEHCGKKFWYSVSVTREYEAYTDEEK